MLPKKIENWSLTSLQQRLVKTGGPSGQARTVLLAAVGGERCLSIRDLRPSAHLPDPLGEENGHVHSHEAGGAR